LKRFVSPKTDFLGDFRTGARTLICVNKKTTIDNNRQKRPKSPKKPKNFPQLPQFSPTLGGIPERVKTSQNKLTEEEPEGIHYEKEYANTSNS
jgi:hypothetical protein